MSIFTKNTHERRYDTDKLNLYFEYIYFPLNSLTLKFKVSLKN